jgi:hypothetical protein
MKELSQYNAGPLVFDSSKDEVCGSVSFATAAAKFASSFDINYHAGPVPQTDRGQRLPMNPSYGVSVQYASVPLFDSQQDRRGSSVIAVTGLECVFYSTLRTSRVTMLPRPVGGPIAKVPPPAAVQHAAIGVAECEARPHTPVVVEITAGEAENSKRAGTLARRTRSS